MRNVLEVLLVATRLGVTSFGGPIAHIGYFRQEYVVRRGWLTEERFAELVALCQFLPGPASSQLGIAVGIRRAGIAGGFAAWLGFTLPSALALILFAYGVQSFDGQAGDWLHGLKIVAVAVVALALWGMGRTLAPDRPRITIAVLAAVVALAAGGIVAQLAVIAAGAALGLAFLRPPELQSIGAPGKRTGAVGFVPAPPSTFTVNRVLAGAVVFSASLKVSESVVWSTTASTRLGFVVSTLWAGKTACAAWSRLASTRSAGSVCVNLIEPLLRLNAFAPQEMPSRSSSPVATVYENTSSVEPEPLA